MSATDAYGNVLPRGTQQQLAKEQATYRRIANELQRAAEAEADPDLCAYCKEHPREPRRPHCSTETCTSEYLKEVAADGPRV